MAAIYNVIVLFDDESNCTYHNVTNPEKLIDNLSRNYLFRGNRPVKAFIYIKHKQTEKKGVYCGWWNGTGGFNYKKI